MAERLRILIADDHPLVRRGMRGVLAGVPDFELVGEATTGREAAALARELQPDVILMDLQMPEGSGIEATRAILAAQPDVRILVVTLFRDDDSVFLALRAGARGYVLKDADEEELVAAIRAVGDGAAIFSPVVATRVLTLFSAPRQSAAEPFPDLTEREREILELIARGFANARIAQELGISIKTIANHISVIFGKLQVAGRAEAIVRARDAGLGSESNTRRGTSRQDWDGLP